MPNYSIVTAFRDALYRTRPQINDVLALSNLRIPLEEELARSSFTRDQKALYHEELNIIEWGYTGLYTEEELSRAKVRLKALAFSQQAPFNGASKWENNLSVTRSVVDTLSKLATHVSASQDSSAIKRENLLSEIDNLQKKLEDKKRKENKDTFTHLQSIANEKAAFDLRAFMHYLILYYQEDPSSEHYVKNLDRSFARLTDEEIKFFYNGMRSKAMVSFVNALFTQYYIMEQDRCRVEQQNNKAYKDALSLLPLNIGWVKGEIIAAIAAAPTSVQKNTEVEDLAEDRFYSTAAHVYKTVSMMYEKLSDAIDSRNLKIKNKDSFPYYTNWPVDKDNRVLPISISSAEKDLISESIKTFRHKQLTSVKRLDEYFGKMMHSLGYFFNPNQFCDVLYSYAPFNIKYVMTQRSKAECLKLHQILQGEDLNHLVLLLRKLKEGDAEVQAKCSEWLSLSQSGILWQEKLQVLAEKLYDSANILMQSVREQLEKQGEKVNDYAYNNLELKTSHLYTAKNAACMKRLLETYGNASSKYDFTYNICDRFYLFMYPGEKLKEVLTSDSLHLPADIVRVCEDDEQVWVV